MNAPASRLALLDWSQITGDLDAHGCARIERLLTEGDCAALIALYAEQDRFRKRIVMARHGYGQGEYQYFAYPLPEPVARLRETFYPPLAEIANRWNVEVGIATRFPADHATFLERCHEAGQIRPTPLMLRYGAGDYNRLHQDLHGEHVFPLQLTVLLSEPTPDFTGGEFVLTEQLARMQSRPEVVALGRGDAVVFAVNQRPVRGPRGFARAATRHGVSRLHGGERFALGIIFHDAA